MEQDRNPQEIAHQPADAPWLPPEAVPAGPPVDESEVDAGVVSLRPPMALWRLYLLILGSLGIYWIFWIGRTGAELRRLIDPKRPAWLYVAGSLIPLVNFFTFHVLVRRIQAVGQKHGADPGIPVWGITLAFVLVFAVVAPANLIKDLPESTLIPFILGTNTLSAIPLLMAQRNLNRVKAALPDVTWHYPPGRFIVRHYVVMVLGFLLLGMIATVQVYEWTTLTGKPLARGDTVSGSRELYSVIVPDDGWTRLDPKKHDPDADLILLGSDASTLVKVFVSRRSSRTLDSATEARWDLLAQDAPIDAYEERREFLPGTLIPVSYARYGQSGALATDLTWTATVIHDGTWIEVLALTDNARRQESNLKFLIDSFKLTGLGTFP
ncbi:MAG: hypothetical protein KDE22_00670 [Rhodobacterales bacterium]|nr:hypothetical protein [Rhodobacterales bacterium]